MSRWITRASSAPKRALLLLSVVAAVGLFAECTPPGGGGGGNKKPVAVANANPGTGSMEIAFSSAGSNDPDGTIVGWEWTFGDAGSLPSTEENPTHVYATPGTYVVTLTVTDDKGATGTATVSVTVPVVPNQPPVAGATATPNEGPAPLLVQFSSAGTTDPEGQPISAYEWNFGDGVTSTAANPSHTYAALGDFNVTLTVTDASGASDDTTVLVRTWEAQIENTAQGRCADLANSNTSNGTHVGSYPCTKANHQRWVFEANGRITTGLSATKCLDALGGGALGANVGIYDCNGALNQRWIRDGAALVNDANDLCLAAKDGHVEPGTPLVLATCNPADPAQQWEMKEWKAAEFKRLRNTAVDRCTVIKGNSLANGRDIVDWACVDDSSMGWYLDPNGMMLNRLGLDWCMDGTGGNDGNDVEIWECGDTQTWQRWHISGDQLVNNTNNLCLTRQNSTGLPNTRMILKPCDTNDPNQQFAFEATGQWAWHRLRNPVTGMCIGVSNTNNNTKLQPATCDGSDGQRWYHEVGGRLFHRWQQGDTGKCADATSNSANDVVVYDCNTQVWQNWTADTLAQSLKSNGLCLEAVDAYLKTKACDGSDAQRWVVETL